MKEEVKIDKANDPEQCKICFYPIENDRYEFKEKDTLRFTCNHTQFHSKCIWEFLTRNTDKYAEMCCPCCYSEIVKNNI